MIYGAPELFGLVAAGWWATQFKSLPDILPWWILGILSATGSTYSSHREPKYKKVKQLNLVWLSIIGFFVSYQFEHFFWVIRYPTQIESYFLRGASVGVGTGVAIVIFGFAEMAVGLALGVLSIGIALRFPQTPPMMSKTLPFYGTLMGLMGITELHRKGLGPVGIALGVGLFFLWVHFATKFYSSQELIELVSGGPKKRE